MVTVIKKGMNRKQINSILDRNKITLKNKIDIKKYCGVLILKEDPLEIQKKLRNEWE
ncbi:MAG: hypothetical protein IPH62_17875 [Ignavibacteriae bacterium]|nr:hypothetical protein [Ignavibacteriota bacterium]